MCSTKSEKRAPEETRNILYEEYRKLRKECKEEIDITRRESFDKFCEQPLNPWSLSYKTIKTNPLSKEMPTSIKKSDGTV